MGGAWGILLILMGLSTPAFADPTDYLLTPEGSRLLVFNGRYTIDGSYLGCPCARMSVTISTMGGQITTRHFIVSSASLFQFSQRNFLNSRFLTARVFNAGAVEALYQGGTVGLGFEGITWGQNQDQNLSQIFQTGAYAIFNLFQNERLRLTLSSGYHREEASFNLYNRLRQNEWRNSLNLRWHTEHWSAHVRGNLSLPQNDFGNPNRWIASADSSVEARWLTPADLQLGAGINALYNHRPYRRDYETNVDEVVASIFFELSWLRALDIQ